MSLLTICQDAVLEVGAGSAPAAVASSSETLPKQLLAWAKAELDILAHRHNWQALIAEQTITTANGTETYALPSDWDRYISETFWDATNYWPVPGSVAAATWQALKRGIIPGVQSRKNFRVKGSLVYIFPTPTSVTTLIGEYITNKPVSSALGVAKATFTADDDTCLLPERLIRMGIKWRLLRAKGFDYTEEMNEQQREIELAIARDTPSPTLDFSTPRETLFIPNIPTQIT